LISDRSKKNQIKTKIKHLSYIYMGCRGYPKKKNSPICYGRFGFLFFFCFVKEISEENFSLKKKTKQNKKG